MEKIIKSFFITLGSLILACGAVLGCYFAIKGLASTGGPGITDDTNPAAIVSDELSLNQMADAFKDLDETMIKACPNGNVAIKSTITTIENSKKINETTEFKCANGIQECKEIDKINGDTVSYKDLSNINNNVVISIDYDTTAKKWYNQATVIDTSMNKQPYSALFEANKDKFIYNEEAGAYVAELSDSQTMAVKFIKGKVVYFEIGEVFEDGVRVRSYMLYNHGKVSVTLPESEIRPN